MTTATAVPADVISYRYASRSKTGEKIGHLLTRSWPEQPGYRGRPALCGVRRQRWRPVHLFDHPADFENCEACSAAAGITPEPQQPPVRIAPDEPARHTHRAVSAPDERVVNTQIARVRRRVAFRDQFRIAREARNYQPRRHCG